VDIAPYNSRGT